MKLADASSDSVRQRLRQSNLDDLESAFKEESPLTDSYASSTVHPQAKDWQKGDSDPSDLYIPLAKEETSKLIDTATTSRSKPGDGLGLGSGSATISQSLLGGTFVDNPLPSEGIINVSDNSNNNSNNPMENNDSSGLGFSTSDNGINSNRGETNVSSGLGFPATTNSVGSGLHSTGRRENSSAIGILSQNSAYNSTRYGPVNPPQFERNRNRRQIIGAVIIMLAIIGLLIGLLAPGISSRSTRNQVNGTFSPTFSPTTDRYDTQMDRVYLDASDILNDAMISYPFMLGKDCHHTNCNGSGDIDKLDIRDQVLHYLVFKDSLFREWIFREEFDNTERVAQRYIITLFAFETGLIKNADDGGNTSEEWELRTWDRYDKWLSKEEECDWFGITCETRSAYVNTKDFKDHTFFTSTAVARDLPNRPVQQIPMITSISLNQNNLKGNLIPELFKLRHLERVELWQAELRGSLNRDIKLLASLRKLWLHETKNIAGTIPSELGELIDLESIFIGDNALTGSLPSELGNLKSLNTLAVYENNLQGEIPNELSSCVLLERLFLDDNELNGTIPIALGALTSLNDVRLNDNQLTGSLPLQFGEMVNLEVLYLGNNKLTGNIADIVVVGWQKMKYFEAADNQFTGTIPMRFGNLPSLIALDLHSNKLNSQIPSNICNGVNKSLKKIDLSNNMVVTGKIPEEMSKCSDLVTLSLSNNQMSGDLPTALYGFENLKTLNLDRNLFTGGVGSGLGGPRIETIRLVQNDFKGTISEDLCDRTDFISSDCGNDGRIVCENNCCECCGLFCN